VFGNEHKVFRTAREAAELVLGLGRDSYRPDILEQKGDKLLISPLAGQIIETQLIEAMQVGPSSGAGNYHITMSLTCDGHFVQAYCMTAVDSRSVCMVEVYLYVDGQYVVHRVVSVAPSGFLEAYGAPPGKGTKKPR
jgi:hypothetical protein